MGVNGGNSPRGRKDHFSPPRSIFNRCSRSSNGVQGPPLTFCSVRLNSYVEDEGAAARRESRRQAWSMQVLFSHLGVVLKKLKISKLLSLSEN